MTTNAPVKFEVKADDKFATVNPDVNEYATVKQSSGFLSFEGQGTRGLARAQAYSAYQQEESGQGRVVVFRPVGTVDWFVLDAVEVEVPDSLPADFS